MDAVQLPRILYALPRNPMVAVGLPVAVGYISGYFTQYQVKTWFARLQKPPGQPGNKYFPIFWTSLYAGVGLSTHLIVNAFDNSPPGSPTKAIADLALKLYYAQYAINLLWTPTFFYAHNIGASLIELAIMTPITFAFAHYACQVDRRTVYCAGPYALWIGYALYLNSGVYRINCTTWGKDYIFGTDRDDDY